MKFYKYHALGNDYIVIDPAEFTVAYFDEEFLIAQMTGLLA